MKKLFLLFLAVLCLTGCKTSPRNYTYNKETTASLVIGVEDSKAFGKCVGSKVDAERMSELLKDYSSRQIVLVSNKAMKNVVEDSLKEVCKYDLAIIYYSGHGGSIAQDPEALFYAEPSGYDSFLCLWDLPMLDNDIWDIVSKAKGRVVMIFDCCHSATMFRDPATFFRFGTEAETFAAARNPDQPQILVLSGCPDESYSYGSSAGGEMTLKLLKHYRKSRTYDSVFSRVVDDPGLKAQKPSMTEIGDSFKSEPIFR